MTTLLHIILDRSGSMSTIWDDTLGGLNEYVNKLKSDGNDYRFSLTVFDNEIETVVNDVKPSKFNGVPNDVSPRGMTALYDAIGQTVSKINPCKHEKALVVIITDGQENVSSEYNQKQINKLISGKEKDGFTFVFLGANQDSFATGGAMGMATGNTSNFNFTGQGIRNAFSVSAVNTTAYAASAARTTGTFYSADDQENIANVSN